MLYNVRTWTIDMKAVFEFRPKKWSQKREKEKETAEECDRIL